MYDSLVVKGNVKLDTKVDRIFLGLKPRVIDDYVPCWMGIKSPMIARMETIYRKPKLTITKGIMYIAILLLSMASVAI